MFERRKKEKKYRKENTDLSVISMHLAREFHVFITALIGSSVLIGYETTLNVRRIPYKGALERDHSGGQV